MIFSEFVKVIIFHQNIKHYQSLSYLCNVGDEIEVKVSDIPKKSKIYIEIKCDYCEKIFKRQVSNHHMQTEKDIIKKDSCRKCAGLKRVESNLFVYGVSSTTKLTEVKNKMKETMIEKYGVEHQMHLDSVKRKIKDTNIQKYGTETPSKNDQVKEKIKKTSRKRYGVNSYTQTDEYKTRVKETNLIKYGFENVAQNKEIKEKIKTKVRERYGCDNLFQNEQIKEKSKCTMIEKYGVDHPMRDKTIKEKVISRGRETMSKNGNVKTSKQQLYLHNLFGGELNFPVDNINLDIAFPDDKIYIEYNGGGHDLQVKMGKMSQESFNAVEIKRYYFLKKLGWKQIIINSPHDYLPTDEVLLYEFDQAKVFFNQNKGSHFKININNKENTYGTLRKII